MKNLIFKILIFSAFIFNMTACGNFFPGSEATGTWENTIKNSDGSSVTTTLEIKETIDTFSATMSAKVNGAESETLKLTTPSIKLSGVVNGKTLSITDIVSDSESSETYSSLEVSKDNTFITMYPGQIKFRKNK